MAGLLDYGAFGTGSPAETAQQPSGMAALLSGAYNAMGLLAKRAMGNSANAVGTGTYDAAAPMEAAMMAMTGGLAGVPMKAGEAVLGAGPVRRSALPMDEASRLARAQEQGYTIDAYKGGQPYDWNTMPETNWKGEVIKGTENRVPVELTSINSPNSPYAGFFSNDPKVADRFAAPFEHGAVWPTKLKFENPLVIDAQGKHAAAFQFDSIARDPKNNTITEMNKFHGAFKEGSPHDGVILKNTKDEGDVYIPRNPDQIRSRFAAFDPAKIGSGELLGSLVGAGILGPMVTPRER
jgi:hypothetical protein